MLVYWWSNNYSSIKKFTENIIQQNINTNILLFQELIITPVSIYDLATLDNVTEKFVKTSNVESVVIKDSNNLKLSEFKVDYHHHGDNVYHLEKTIDIKDDEQKYGTAYILFDLSNIQDQIDKNTENVIIIVFFEIIISLIISFIIGKKLSSHLTQINLAIKNVAKKELNFSEVKINSGDEFEELGENFNLMQNRLKNEIERNMEQKSQLLEQSKLASMGELIGNIAHQWRQPLSVITSAVSGLKLKGDLGMATTNEDLTNLNETVLSQAKYLSNTIDDFRDFIKEDDSFQELNFFDLIDSTISLVTPALKENFINLITTENSQDFTFLANKNELQQALINIINNSKDALSSKILREDERFIFIDSKKIDDKIEVQIYDSANGIDINIINKIFEPYFTTKHKSMGTGLGLSMVHKIIKQRHGFDIKVFNKEFKYKNKNYKGACFSIVIKVI